MLGECPSGQNEFILVRTTKGYAYEESLSIYFGTDTSTTPVYEETENSQGNNAVYTHTICLNTGVHTVVMGDTFGDGWNSGSQLQVFQGEREVASITWTCTKSQTTSCTTTFSTTELPAWQFTSTPQTGSDWTTGTIDWPSSSSGFPAPTTTTHISVIYFHSRVKTRLVFW